MTRDRLPGRRALRLAPVSKNISLPLRCSAGHGRRASRVREMIELVDLGFENHHRGNYRRNAARRDRAGARFAPPLLLMDELVRRLDEITRSVSQANSCRSGDETGVRLLFVTHSISEAVFLSTRGGHVAGRGASAARDVDAVPARSHARVVALLRARHRGARASPRWWRPGARRHNDGRRTDRGRGPMSRTPVAVQPLPRRNLGRRVGRRVQDWAPAVAVFILVIAAWENSSAPSTFSASCCRRSRTSSRRSGTTPTLPAWRASRSSRRLAASCSARSPRSSSALMLAHWRGLGSAIAIRDRRQRDPDHRLRPITNHWFAARPRLEDGDRSGPSASSRCW